MCQAVVALQGYDASGKDDEELPPEQQEASDDEAERAMRGKRG